MHSKIPGDILPNAFKAGSNQLGVKQYNEKLVIDVVRKLGAVSKADITRITQLSAQTITIIANRLIEENILIKGKTIRGKVGQPSVLLELNPQGALSIGVKLGRRTSQIIVMSFTFDILAERSLHYDYPDPANILGWAEAAIAEIFEELSPEQLEKLVGVGLAMPAHLDLWEGVIEAPAGTMSGWQEINVANWLRDRFKLPVYEINDATAACMAELSVFPQTETQNCLYFYIGTFFGAGIALDGKIYDGHTGHAGSVASLPLSLPQKEHASPQQLLSKAGLHTLETQAISKGYTSGLYFSDKALDDVQEALFENWSDDVARALAFAIISGQCFLDAPEVMIDGRLSQHLITRIIDKVDMAFAEFDVSGITLPNLSQGRLGAKARPMGAAVLPLLEHFSLYYQ